MDFLLIIISTFGLAAFLAIWLSISFVAIGLYKSDHNIYYAISLARIASRMQYVLLVWFLILAIMYSLADNFIWLLVYLLFFVGLVVIIRKVYGDILHAVYSIVNDDGSDDKKLVAQKAVAKIEPRKFNRIKRSGFNRFKIFFFAIDGAISIGAVLNIVLRDNSDISTLEVIFANITLVIAIQIILLPIYFIVRSIVFVTIPKE